MSNWTCEQRDRYNIENAHDIIHKHRLLAHHSVEAAGQCALLAQSDVWELLTGEGERAAVIFVRGGMDEFVAYIDVIPSPEHFRVKDDYRNEVASALEPLISGLVADGVGRISSKVPSSRTRTMKCLKAAGFEFEGKLKRAVSLDRSRCREDLYLYALMIEDGENEEARNGS